MLIVKFQWSLRLIIHQSISLLNYNCSEAVSGITVAKQSNYHKVNSFQPTVFLSQETTLFLTTRVATLFSRQVLVTSKGHGCNLTSSPSSTRQSLYFPATQPTYLIAPYHRQQNGLATLPPHNVIDVQISFLCWDWLLYKIDLDFCTI